MTLNDTKQQKEQLAEILKEMDLPVMRTNLNSFSNLRWLMRNIGVRNREHPRFKEATGLIRNLVRSER
tara:strand:+ start:2061 stop:2264 length:204 start_codon:yes stop_codon:yes gene_type:complete